MMTTQNGHNRALSTEQVYGKIDARRKVEIFSQMVRHCTALIMLIAELVIGVKPDRL